MPAAPATPAGMPAAPATPAGMPAAPATPAGMPAIPAAPAGMPAAPAAAPARRYPGPAPSSAARSCSGVLTGARQVNWRQT